MALLCGSGCFGLGRGNVSDGFEEAPVVVPVDPFHRGQLDGVETALGPFIRSMRHRGDRVWGAWASAAFLGRDRPWGHE
jgi:hypothetical protein